jgi:hypothetical protein
LGYALLRDYFLNQVKKLIQICVDFFCKHVPLPMSTVDVNSVIPNDLISSNDYSNDYSNHHSNHHSNDSYVNDFEAQAYATMQKMNQMQRWRWALRGIVIE